MDITIELDMLKAAHSAIGNTSVLTVAGKAVDAAFIELMKALMVRRKMLEAARETYLDYPAALSWAGEECINLDMPILHLRPSSLNSYALLCIIFDIAAASGLKVGMPPNCSYTGWDFHTGQFGAGRIWMEHAHDIHVS